MWKYVVNIGYKDLIEKMVFIFYIDIDENML